MCIHAGAHLNFVLCGLIQIEKGAQNHLKISLEKLWKKKKRNLFLSLSTGFSPARVSIPAGPAASRGPTPSPISLSARCTFLSPIRTGPCRHSLSPQLTSRSHTRAHSHKRLLPPHQALACSVALNPSSSSHKP